jgi:hypothetical protein
MAKRRASTEGKKMPTATLDSSLKLVRLELPESVHKQFRVEAAKEGVSMAAMARRLVEEWVVRRKAGGK